ncbi:hypothetical protein [Tomitella gaofuii]|uniref:hypothetical protein n=1 Tax=Tomitella gaofuii TaxID=2760083 RepID=UPI0015F9BF47|nr:hypothetical protein [Tomitella gaofuii]
MKKTMKKVVTAAAATAAAGGMALAMAPAASASTVGELPVAPGFTNVTDQVTPYDAPGAFNPGPGAVLVSPAYGTATVVACRVDAANIWRDCHQRGWAGEWHQVHYVANVNGHPTFVTVDLPQGSSVPQLPVIELPAGSVSGSLVNIMGGLGAGSTGSGGGGAQGGLNLNLGGSLGDIGLGLQGGVGSS